jgi:hypothetical protein
LIVGAVGQAISPDVPVVSGTSVNYSIDPALLAGLSLDPSTGKISGTPTTPTLGYGVYIVTASNASGVTTATVAIKVISGSEPFNLIYPLATIVAEVGKAIEPDVPTLLGTISSYSISPPLPTGLEIDPSTGTISGTPTAAEAPTVYTVTATAYSGEAAAATIQLSVGDMSTTAAGIYTFGYSFDTAPGLPFAINQFSKAAGTPLSTSPNQILSGRPDLVPTAIAIDKSGRIYVGARQFDGTTQTGLEVLVYNAGAHAAAAAAQTVNFSFTGSAGYVRAIAVDDVQNLYVYIVSTNGTGNGTQTVFEGITVLTRAADGTYAPSRTISGNGTTISSVTQIAVDAAGNIYAANLGSSSILIFDSNATGNTPPTASLIPYPISSPEGVALDSTGNIYVSGLTDYAPSSSVWPLTIDPFSHATISEFAPGSTGTAAPSRIVSGSYNSGEFAVGNVAVGNLGELYVTIWVYPNTDSRGAGILEYGSSGSAAVGGAFSDLINQGIAVY